MLKAIFATAMAGILEGIVGGIIAETFTEVDFSTGFLIGGGAGAVTYWIWAYIGHRMIQSRQ